jgi:hypothetical protein
VLRPQAFLERRVVEQVDLADRDVDGRSTIGINGLRLRFGERSCGRGCPVFGVELPKSSELDGAPPASARNRSVDDQPGR